MTSIVASRSPVGSESGVAEGMRVGVVCPVVGLAVGVELRVAVVLAVGVVVRDALGVPGPGATVLVALGPATGAGVGV